MEGLASADHFDNKEVCQEKINNVEGMLRTSL